MIETSVSWRITPPIGQPREETLAHCDRVMEALLDLEEAEGQVHSAAVSLDLSQMIVTIDLAAETDDVLMAERWATDALRRSVARAGGNITGAHLLGRRAELIPG